MLLKLPYVTLLLLFFITFNSGAQSNRWHKESSSAKAKQATFSEVNVTQGTLFSLEENSFIEDLKTSVIDGESNIIYFPNEKGLGIPYTVTETSVLSKELALKYPNIKSYVGQNLNDNSSKVHFSVSHKGVQAMFTSLETDDSWYIQKTETEAYLLYNRKENTSLTDDEFICRTAEKVTAASNLSSKVLNTGALSKYRLAVSASGDYTAYHGGTKEDALAAIVATVTRVNVVFNTDLGITLELIANTDDVIYTDASTDPYGDSSNSYQNWADEAHEEILAVIGTDNFDIGHLFHQGDDFGLAEEIGSVCRNRSKAAAYSSYGDPIGDEYDIGYVAHEMGHQFGANHTFSHTNESSDVQAEPGSGTTIMGYAGTAYSNNVADSSSPYFHYYSILQIDEYLDSRSCGTIVSTSNTAPEISTPDGFYIPKGTAFFLEGSATDIDTNDVLTYAWEQIDDGTITDDNFGPTNTSGANFRSLPPTASPIRYFPKMEQVLAGQLTQTNPTVNDSWETVSTVEREMNFALTVRDNALNGGEQAFDVVGLYVIPIAGPFKIDSHATNETYTAGDTSTILWDVANTYTAPVSTEEVKIMLSVDGGTSFPIVLADNVVNDGEHQIILPNVNTSQARIMVQAVDNVYFAVNASDFTIIETDFILDFTALEYEVCQNDALTVTFNYEASAGFNETTSFSIPDLPQGLVASFSEVSTNTSATITIDFTGFTGTTSGQYTIPLIAESASQSKTVDLIVTINADEIADVILQTPLNNRENVSTDIALTWEDNSTSTLFDVEVATDEAFINIVESATTVLNEYEPYSLQSNTEYYWRVKSKNSCADGNFGEFRKFTTAPLACTSESAIDLPLEIPSATVSTRTSNITFVEDIILKDVNVTLELDHSYLGDLTITLISPSGTEVTLFTYQCTDELNTIITFDDDSTATFDCDNGIDANGTYQSIDALNVFNGESLQGEWTLKVKDLYSGDGGSVSSFSLEYCTEDLEREDADADSVFDDVDLCLNTPAGATVNENGCEIYDFTTTDFVITSQDPSCATSNDGEINIAANLNLDYQVLVNGEAIEEGTTPNNFLANELASGTHDICIEATNGANTYNQYCFQVVINNTSATCDIDADNDGVLDDGTDLCLQTPAGAIVNENGCEIYNFTTTDFVITSQDPSCATSNDGEINIAANLNLDYQVLVNGEAVSEDSTTPYYFTANELASGTHDICIEATNGANTYNQYCFQVVINNTSLACDIDADNDGVLDDGTDLCLQTPAGAIVNENGCEIYNFTTTDFVITSQDLSCATSNDGEINIAANLNLDYQVLVNGEAVSEDSTTPNYFTANELASGTHDICIEATNGANTYNQYCFQVVINNTAACEIDADNDADNDGVLDDGTDLCLETPEGVLVNENGCEIYTLNENDFSIAVQKISCSESSLKILSNISMNYETTITGEGFSLQYFFSDEYEFTNLEAGNYTICIAGDNGKNTYEAYCFETTIETPGNFTVSSNTNFIEQKLELNLSGATQFTVSLNDEEIVTTESELTLDLKPGLNTVKVFTENTCQEPYEEQVLISKDMLVYPNPFDSELVVLFNSYSGTATLSVFSETGKLMSSSVYEIDGESLDLELGFLASGRYFLRLEGVNLSGVIQLIKK